MAEELIKILLVDDDEEDYIITRDMLSDIDDWRFHLEWVAKYDAALEGLVQVMKTLIQYWFEIVEIAPEKAKV